jgi:HIV Tat-specific factor 1
MHMWWYVDVDGSVLGPAGAEALAALFAGGDVDGMTRVRQARAGDDLAAPSVEVEGDHDWTPLAQVPELRAAAVATNAVGDDEGIDADEAGAGDICVRKPTALPKESTALLSYRPESPSKNAPPSSHRPFLSPPVPSCADEELANVVRPRELDTNDAAEREAKKVMRKRSRAVARGRERARRSVYVTGVPTDASDREMVVHFAKCGILMPDAHTGRPSLRLYTDADGRRKGDARVTYAMDASVENALLLLDGVPLRDDGAPMTVARAKFDEAKAFAAAQTATEAGGGGGMGNGEDDDAGESGGTKKRRRMSSGKLKGAGQKVVREVLGWQDDANDEGAMRRTSIRMVVLLNVFNGSAAVVDYAAVRTDMATGCEACGAVERVIVFERSDVGAVLVRFRDGIGARKCIDVMHERWYDGRKITAEYYDGVTDYRVGEGACERGEREKAWEEWLGVDEGDGSEREL